MRLQDGYSSSSNAVVGAKDWIDGLVGGINDPNDEGDSDGIGGINIPDYVIEFPDRPIITPKETNPIKGIESQGSPLNVAGYWVVGVGKGTLIMIVPMLAIGLTVGFMKRIVNLGTRMGES
jgi:hypothetical protein